MLTRVVYLALECETHYNDKCLACVLFRFSGQVGDWKNWFTVAQNEWFDNFIKEKMKTAKLKFIYSL